METYEGTSTVEATEALGMNTYERISADEAAEALAAAEGSRARVAWSGYPSWYWLTTGAGLGLATYLIGQQGWWGPAIAVVIAAGVTYLAYAAAKARGVCAGWVRGAMTTRDWLLLYGPATLVIVASAFWSKYATWPPIAGGVLAFALFAGTGLAMGARAARR
jgi:hypothetical protein